MKMAIPAFPEDAKGLLKTAIRDDDPVFFLESERLLSFKDEVPEEEYTIPFGQALVRRPGSDCTLVSFGRPVHFCLEAAETLDALLDRFANLEMGSGPYTYAMNASFRGLSAFSVRGTRQDAGRR